VQWRGGEPRLFFGKDRGGFRQGGISAGGRGADRKFLLEPASRYCCKLKNGEKRDHSIKEQLTKKLLPRPENATVRKGQKGEKQCRLSFQAATAEEIRREERGLRRRSMKAPKAWRLKCSRRKNPRAARSTRTYKKLKCPKI